MPSISVIRVLKGPMVVVRLEVQYVLWLLATVQVYVFLPILLINKTKYKYEQLMT